jgi:hypothetical protein
MSLMTRSAPVQPFEVTGTIGRAGLTRALRAFPGVNRRRWAVFGGNLLVWVALAVVFGGGAGIVVLAVVAVLAVGAITVATPWTLPLRAGRSLGLDRPATWRFGPDGVRVTGPLGTTEVAWDRVAEVAPGAMLTKAPQVVFTLPPLTADQSAAVAAWRAAPDAPAPAGAVPLHAVPPGGGTAGRIVATGMPTPAQTAAYVHLAASRIVVRRLLLASVAVGLLAAGVFLAGLPRPWTGDHLALAAGVLVGCGVLVGMCVATGVLVSRLLRPLTGRFDRRRIWGDTAPTWWFERDRLGVSAATSAEIPWSRVTGVSVRDEMLVLHLEPHGVIAAPLTAFAPGDAARVVTLARDAGVTVHPSAEPVTAGV